MFIYEKDSKLNIMFQATQIPVAEDATPDVQLYKDGETVHVTVGGKEVSVAASQGTK